MSVLGVMFHSKLEWSLQVENSVILNNNREIGFDNFLFFTRVSTTDYKYGSYLLSKDP
jgi:hypothetical protein